MLETETQIHQVPSLDLKAQYALIREEIRAAIDRVADAQQFILGPEVEGLEQEIAAYSRTKYAVGVSSGTDALLASLMATGINPGDEVITTPYSFFATAGSIARLGARPVFVDCDSQTYNIAPDQIEPAITERTRAIMPVHLFGQMAEMNQIMEIARRHNLVVIEDAAQSIGSEFQGQRAGSIGDFGCFSFFPSKNLGGFGDGGMITTNSRQMAGQLKVLRTHGYETRYYHRVAGGNFRLDAIQAAVLRVKLKYLDVWIELRQKKAENYRSLFHEAGLENVTLPYEAPGRRHTYNQFVIRGDQRDDLLAHLNALQIATHVYYPVPLHLQGCFASLGYAAGDFPASEQAAQQTLALPIYPELTDAMMRAVVDGVAGFYLGRN
jgi:dTDP-4-amino-4,6-dideoxygalactose transaminase